MDTQQVYQLLHHQEIVQANVCGEILTVEFDKQAQRLYLWMPIFKENNFIPNRVRSYVYQHQIESYRTVRAQLSIDEDQSQVMLSYCGYIGELNAKSFDEIVEDFYILAKQQEEELNCEAEKDLVYIYQK